jgi:amino-acid N-acetyltransferase
MPQLLDLVARCGLPLDGLAEHQRDTLAAIHDGRIVGCAAVERYGVAGLLRSVAVDPDWRGQGLGDRLLAAVVAHAQAHGVTDLYLLTDTAAAYFARRGFAPVDRATVAPAVTASVEFTTACPASAQAMFRRLAG